MTIEIPAVELSVNEWGEVVDVLSEGGFTTEDVEWVTSVKGEDSSWHRAAQVLMAVHEKLDMHMRTGAMTVVYATETWRKSSTVTGADVLTMADNRVGWRDSVDAVVADVLHDHYNRLPLDYVTEDAKMQLFKDYQQKNQIWLWDDGSPMSLHEGVWIFQDPDAPSY